MIARVCVGVVAGVLVCGISACGEKSKIGQPCTDVSDDEYEICEDLQLLRCDGRVYRVLAECHHQCVTGPGTAHAGGELSADETWTCAEGPHHVNGVVSVADGATLTIEAGAEVRLLPSTSVNVAPAARVVVDAPAGSEVLFTSDNELAGGFGTGATGGLNLFASADVEPSVLRGLIVERGQHGVSIAGLSERADELPVVENCTFRDNVGYGILARCESTDVVLPDYTASGNSFFANGVGDVSSCAAQ
jgi:hypothetical protein